MQHVAVEHVGDRLEAAMRMRRETGDVIAGIVRSRTRRASGTGRDTAPRAWPMLRRSFTPAPSEVAIDLRTLLRLRVVMLLVLLAITYAVADSFPSDARLAAPFAQAVAPAPPAGRLKSVAASDQVDAIKPFTGLDKKHQTLALYHRSIRSIRNSSMASAPRITLEQWQALVTVVDAGSYARAAEQLHKTQSTLTYAVQKIESLLDVKAFDIRGRKAVLTPTGHLLYRRARVLLDEASGVENAARRISAGWEAEIASRWSTSFRTR